MSQSRRVERVERPAARGVESDVVAVCKHMLHHAAKHLRAARVIVKQMKDNVTHRLNCYFRLFLLRYSAKSTGGSEAMMLPQRRSCLPGDCMMR